MKKKKQLSKEDNYYKILPLALILLIIPCIVYLKVCTVTGAATNLAPAGNKIADFFNYYKSIWLIVFTALSAVFCIIYAKSYKLKLKLPVVCFPLLAYYLFVFLSTGFSKYHDVAFWGYPDRREGFFVITCYVLICLIAATFVTYEKDIRILFGAIVICGLVIGVLGITQFWGADLFQTNFGKKLIVPPENYNLLDSLTFKFPKQYIYSTLYNPNYVGSFSAILFPISIALVVLAKKPLHKILACIFSFIIFINLIGCLSQAGIVGSALAVILLIVLLRKQFFKAWPSLIALAAGFAILFVSMNNLSDGTILNLFLSDSNQKQTTQLEPAKYGSSSHNATNVNIANGHDTSISNASLETQKPAIKTQQSRTYSAKTIEFSSSKTSELKASTLDFNESDNSMSTSSKPVVKEMAVQQSPAQQAGAVAANPVPVVVNNITDFSIKKNTFIINLGEKQINMTFDSGSNQCSFTDASGNTLEVQTNPSSQNKTYTFKDANYAGLSIESSGNYFKIAAPNTSFNISIDLNEKKFKFVNARGEPMDIASPESIGFQGKENWASARGYIWSRSLPLLKNTLILGGGPDTFALQFPQNEFNTKLKCFNTPYIVVDKPHNMYLQMALNSGVVSMVAFIIFAFWYFINAIVIYIKPKGEKNTYYFAGICCLTAVVGFLVSGLANDSTISVSPVFWIVMGIGIACNRLYMSTIPKPSSN